MNEACAGAAQHCLTPCLACLSGGAASLMCLLHDPHAHAGMVDDPTPLCNLWSASYWQPPAQACALLHHGPWSDLLRLPAFRPCCRWCAAAWACPLPLCACAAQMASAASPAASAPAPWTQPTRWALLFMPRLDAYLAACISRITSGIGAGPVVAAYNMQPRVAQ